MLLSELKKILVVRTSQVFAETVTYAVVLHMLSPLHFSYTNSLASTSGYTSVWSNLLWVTPII